MFDQDELRNKILLDILYDTNAKGSHIEALADLVQQERAKARIDELQKLDDEHQTTSQDLEREKPGYTQACVPCEPIWDRIAELSKEQP